MALSVLKISAILLDDFNLHKSLNNEIICVPCSVGVLSCEVALLFSPCLPGASPQAYRLQLWPRLSADSGPDTQGSSEWGWDRLGPPCPGVCCLRAGGQGRPLRADTWLPEAVLCPLAWAASASSSPGSRPSPWLPCLVFHHLSTASQTPQRRRHPQWEDGLDPGRAQGIFQFLPLPSLRLPLAS